jgi:hypothetical protein
MWREYGARWSSASGLSGGFRAIRYKERKFNAALPLKVSSEWIMRFILEPWEHHTDPTTL